MKKILALLLAIVMVIGLAACNQQPDPTEPKETQGAVVTPSDDSGEPAERLPLTTTNEKLVIGIMQNTKVLSYDDNYVTKVLEEKTGVDIEFMFFASGQADARQQLALMVAGGQKLPDIIVGFLDDAMRSELGNEGYLIDHSPYLQDRNYFHYGSKYLDVANETETALFWNRYKDPTSGAIYGVPSISNGGAVDICGFLGGVNFVFAEKLGMNPAEIDTVDEVYQYLTKVVNDDPNGNGKKDEMGILYFPNGNRSNIEQWIVNAYIYWNEGSFFNITDGKVWEPYSTPEFREGFKVLHKWYKEGLISDLSFSIATASEMKVLLETSDCWTIGIFGGHPTSVCSGNGPIAQAYTNFEVLNDETGKGGYTVLRSNISMDMNVSITSDCANPDLAFRFLDHNLNPELGPVFRYGEPGVNWIEIDGVLDAPYASEKTEVFDETGFPAGYHVIKDEWSTETKCTWHSSMNKMWVAEGYANGLNFNPGYGGFAYYFSPGNRNELTWKAALEVKSGTEPAEKFFNVSYNAEEMEIVTEVQADLQDTLNTWRAEFITGVKDPNNDADWNAFLDELEEKGMYDWMDAAQSAYDRFTQG
jgi:putative aldouronate transport system substrate-binding protein